MIDIKDIQGNTLIHLLQEEEEKAYVAQDSAVAVPLNEGSAHHAELMSSDYLKLKFTLKDPQILRMGAYTEDGQYILTEPEYQPQYDAQTGGYKYDLQLDAWYYAWNRYILTLNPRYGAHETTFSLTAYPEDHFKLLLSALRYHNMNIYSGTPSKTFSQYMAQDGATEEGYKVMLEREGCREVECRIQYKDAENVFNRLEHRAYYVNYEGVGILDALNAMCAENAFNCEWWLEENVLVLGRCEYGKNNPVDLELGTELQSVSKSQSSGEYATRIIGYGSTLNVPARYRKSLKLDVTEKKPEYSYVAREYDLLANEILQIQGATTQQEGATVAVHATTTIAQIQVTGGYASISLVYNVFGSPVDAMKMDVYATKGSSRHLLFNGETSNETYDIVLDSELTAGDGTYDIVLELHLIGKADRYVSSGEYMYKPDAIIGNDAGKVKVKSRSLTGKYLIRDKTRKITANWFQEGLRNMQQPVTHASRSSYYIDVAAAAYEEYLTDSIDISQPGARYKATLGLVIGSATGKASSQIRTYDKKGELVRTIDLMTLTIKPRTIADMGKEIILNTTQEEISFRFVLAGTLENYEQGDRIHVYTLKAVTVGEDYSISTYIDIQGRRLSAVVNPAFAASGREKSSWIQVSEDVPLLEKYTIEGVVKGMVPVSMFTDDYPKDTTIVSFEKRLMLPVDSCPNNYIDADSIKDAEGNTIEGLVVEKVVKLDSVYPSKFVHVARIRTYESEDQDPSDETGTSTITRTHYVILLDKEEFMFDKTYMQNGQTLQMGFQTGLLAGMTFAVDFQGDQSGTEAGYQAYEIVLNENYGVTLPNTTLHPAVGDELTLTGYDTSYLSDDGNSLVSEAEHRLKKELEARLAIMSRNVATYNIELMSAYAYGLNDYIELDPEYSVSFALGQTVNLIDAGLANIHRYMEVIDGYLYDANGYPINDESGNPLSIYYEKERKDCVVSRVIGYEIKLDIPYDTPQYIVGESQAYSRLASIQKQITK